MIPFRSPTSAALTIAAWLTAARAFGAAGEGHFQPLGAEFLVNASTSYNQYWPRVGIAPDGTRIAFCFANGQDPNARHFLANGTPATGNLACNPTLSQHVQDEPEICYSTSGNQLVAWSERYGYDGEIMGIFGRIFTPTGAPLGPEFQINQIWQASQWRPLIAARPDGKWLVTWSGDWDGDAMFRVVNPDGTFFTPDIRVNTFDNGAQVDTAGAAAPDGRMLLVFVDFSGYGAIGTGTNLWVRLYDANGAPLQPAPVPLNTSAYTATDQREPRVAADGTGRFLVTWEDQSKDGSGYGIFARRFGNDGQPLGPEFQVNASALGSQRNPKVCADASGNFLIAWEDRATGDADVRAQRFDASGQRLGAEFVVNTVTAGDQKSIGIATHPTSGLVAICFEGPGVSTDAFARLYTTYRPPTPYCSAKLNSLSCAPSIAATGLPSLTTSNPLRVSASLMLNQKAGLLFWGRAGGSVPYYGGTLCVRPPVTRTPIQQSGGLSAGLDCSGTYAFDFTPAYMAQKGLTSGDTVYAQWWSRDPGFTGSLAVSLSNALEFDVTP
ncbi:MAG: hypothetical protein ACKO4Q_02375 [Planctomycetota bacterium]